MLKNYPNYNSIDWQPIIEKYANSAHKYSLIECDGVWITENELQTIQSLNDKVLERLSFTLLCLAKFGNIKNPNNNNWVTIEDSEIYKIANISTSSFDKGIRFNKLKSLGLIAYAKKINNLNIQVLYVDDESTPVFKVGDFRALGHEWRLYKGEKYIRCNECGLLVKKTNNKKKFCRECAKLRTLHNKAIWDSENKNRKIRKIENQKNASKTA